MTAETANPVDPPPLILRTLGDTGLYREGTAAPLLGPGKPFALLVYLALAPGRRTSREFLLDLLWADLDPERARRALRQSLFHLRRLLGEATLTGTEELTLNASVEIDRDRFLSALEHGDLEAALTEYQGAFLPTFGVPGGAAFEHWADLERDRLQAAYLRATDLLARRLLNESRFREAQRLARRARDLAPLNEGAWRLLLEAAIAGHDFVSAAVEADALEQWAGGAQATLDPSTRGVISRARGLSPNPTEAAVESGLVVELTGREREFFAITSAWEASRTGRAAHLHLSAPAGFGKSRLLRDACTRLAAAGAQVVRVHGTRGDREVPFAFGGDLAEAVAALPGASGIAPASAATLVALNPTLSSRFSVTADSAQGEEALRRRIHAVTDLLLAVAHEQPLVLAIDDLHWIDHSSWRLLEAMLGRLDAAHILCLTASRPERQPTDDRCIALVLPALTPAQLDTLIVALGALPENSAWAAEFVGGLHTATGGSPLLVLETLRFALDQGILALEGNEWHCLDEVRLRALLQQGEALRERVRALPAPQAWLLALLATAGAPIDTAALAAAAQSNPEAAGTMLGPLEQQGLVTRTDEGWRVAHDEIAAAAHGALSPEDQVLAHRAIGKHHLLTSDHDIDRTLRAARHFAAAGDDVEVTRLFRRYVRTARSRGDRRTHAELAVALIGDAPTSPRVQRLQSGLPWHWRIGLWSRQRQLAAVVTLLLVPTLALSAARARAGEEASLQRLIYADSSGVTYGVPTRLDEWSDPTLPLVPDRRSTSLTDAARSHRNLPPAVSPDGESVAWIVSAGDSTTLDIWIRNAAGTRRLTNQARDDLVYGWLPDGSALIGTTNRWSPTGNADYDVAVFDTATGAARPVTHGPAQDTNPTVSPDGTRVAFTRVTLDDPPMLCITTLDGVSEPQCRTFNGSPIASLLGWVGLDELVLTIDEAAGRPLVSYDWRRDKITPLLGPYAYRSQLSRDGKWIAAAARIDGVGGFRDVVFPVADPTRLRVVEGPGQIRDVLRWWEGRPVSSWVIDRLEFGDSVRTVLPGIGTRLSIRALSRSGVEIPMRVPITWHSSDTTIATVDSAGEVVMRGDGDVTVSASLAGWRRVEKRIRVAARAPVTVLNEQWDSAWQERWLPWGSPSPVVVTGPGNHPALWNRGDGIYSSMALLRRPLSARDGLGLEVRIATPLTYAQHQRLTVYLVGGLVLSAFEAADIAKGPPSYGEAQLKCGLNFPGEGRWGSTRVAFTGSVTESRDLGELAAQLRSGAWWTLRLQILPDGRCGIAINNRVIWLSSEAIPLDKEYRVWLGEESAGVKLLHGPLQLWTGVRTDIQWTATARESRTATTAATPR